MKHGLRWLVAGCLLFWLALAYPACLLAGDVAVLHSAVAALLCLLPSAATLLWTRSALKGLPEQQLATVLGGTTVRLLFVLGIGMALFYLVPAFHSQGFWIWVIVFYLFTLALEVTLVVAFQRTMQPSETPEGRA
jgi:hypothetical protein